MSNNYLDEFDEEISAINFIQWMLKELSVFISNLSSQGWPKKQTLREWIYTFLCWTEYEDNK